MAISLRLNKSFSYRGAAEIWSNKYHLTGSNPADANEWKAITDALVLLEKTVYTAGVTVVGAAGYTSDTGAAAYTRDFNASPDAPVAGTLSSGSTVATPGDDAVWVRWWCGQYSTGGKRIYLRKYYHDARAGTGGGDAIVAAQKTALTTMANTMRTGITITGYSSRKICDKDGHEAVSNDSVSFITTRTLKRRGGSPL